MTDLDPAIWDNKTLGSAVQNENLERLTRQQQEDHSAKVEKREPRVIVHENTYPDWTPPVSERTGTVASHYSPLRFEDETVAETVVEPEIEEEVKVEEPKAEEPEVEVTKTPPPRSRK
jgi:hypothetical protein